MTKIQELSQKRAVILTRMRELQSDIFDDEAAMNEHSKLDHQQSALSVQISIEETHEYNRTHKRKP